MVVPYLPKAVRVYNTTTFNSRTLSCPTIGAGMRQSLEGMTVSTWLCLGGYALGVQGSAVAGMTPPNVIPQSFNCHFYASQHAPTPNTFFIQGLAQNSPMYISVAFSNGDRLDENRGMNITPGDGYNYTSSMAHLVMSINFETCRVKYYVNDEPVHVSMLVAAGGGLAIGGRTPIMNNSIMEWTITLNGGSTAGQGPLSVFDRYMELDDPVVRRQFIKADRSAVPLPADGHITLDGERIFPTAFFRVTDNSTDAGDFRTNNGTGPPWIFTPDAPPITLDECLIATFIGEEEPPPVLPVPAQARASEWTIKPDWAEPVVETIAWKTDVLSSQMAYEQRRRLRTSPRRVIAANFTLIGAERRLFDSYMIAAAVGSWNYPLWWENMPLSDYAMEGSTVLECDPSNTEVTEGSVVVLIGPTPFIFEAHTVAEVTSNTITLTDGVFRFWPKGSSLYMTKRCWLIGEQRGQRQADDALRVQLQFETSEPNDFPARTAFPTFNGFPVLDLFPDEARDMSAEYRWVLAEFDNQVSAGRLRLDQAGMAFTVQQFTWFADGRAKLKSLRNLLYYLQGRLVPLWVPTYFRDVDIRHDSEYLATDAILIASRSGYSELILTAPYTRQSLQIMFRNGSSLIRDVTTSSVINSEYEALVLSSPLGVAFTAQQVSRACFLTFSRQDQDEIEIEHHTDSTGVSTIATTFAGIRGGRGTNTYETNIFTGSVKQDSGYFPPPEDVQIDEPVIEVTPDPPPDPGYGSGGGGGPE